MKRTFVDYVDDEEVLSGGEEESESIIINNNEEEELPPSVESKIEGTIPGVNNKKVKLEEMLYKYHRFLPSDILEKVPEESRQWRTELLEHMRVYSPNVLTSVEALQSVDWNHFEYSLLLLKRFIEIKYPLLLTEKEELCNILFNMLRLASLNIYSVDFAVQTKCSYALSSLLKRNEKLNITFDWKVLYDLLDKTYFAKFRIATYSPREHGTAIVDLARKMRRYFTNNSTIELLEYFRPFMCIHDHLIFKSQGCLSLFLPTRLEVCDDNEEFKKQHYSLWLNEFMGIWDWIGLYPTWDLSFFSLFSNLAQEQAGYIQWEPYLEFIFTRVMKCFDLPVGNTPLPPTYDEYPMDELNLITPFEYSKNLLLANAAKMIVWLISKNNSTLRFLKQLIKSISNFYQPSNEGSWTTKCADFLLILCTKFGKRLDLERGMKNKRIEEYDACKNSGTPFIPEEFRLTEDECREFVKIVQPLAMTALFSKSNQMTTCANHSLKHLAYILPQEVFPPLMERSFYALETLTSTHQTISALETLSLVVFPLLKYSLYPEGATYLTNLLNLTLPGIDVNDSRKTFSTFKFYTSLLVCVPLCSTSNSSDEREPPEVIRYFEEWSVQLLERIFTVLSHQTDPKSNQVDADLISPNMFWGLCDLLFNQMPDELLDVCLHKVHNFVNTNFLFNAKKNIAHMCSSLSYAYTEQTLALFIPMLYDKLIKEKENGKSLKHLTDTETQYYLHILGQVCYRTGSGLLKYRKQLETIIELTWNSEKKKIVKTCGKLYRNILRSLTKYYPSELRSINNSVWRTEQFQMYDHWKTWGEFLSLDEFEMNWHIPSEEELKFANELVNKYLGTSLTDVKSSINEINETGNIQDLQKLKNRLIFIRYTMRGGNTLFPEITREVLEDLNQYPYSKPIEAGLCVANKCKSVTLQCGYEDVCKALHELSVAFLEKRKDQDPNLLSKICKVIFPMVAMRGGNTRYRYKKKRTSHEFIKQHSYKDVYSRTTNKYPRYLLLIQALLEYKIRCVIHNESIPYTRYHEDLMNDLLELSLHTYSEVRKRAQSVFMSCINKFSEKVIKRFLPKLIDVLADKNSTDEERTGAIYILEKPYSVSCVLRDWDLFMKFLVSLCQTNHIEKHSVQQRLAQLFETYFNAFYHIHISNESDRNKYRNLINSVSELAKNNTTWHWKYRTLVNSFLMLMIRPDTLFPIDSISFIFRQMVSDLEKTRQIACEAANLILCQYKPKQPRKIISPEPRTRENMIDWQVLDKEITDPETWKNSNFYEKNFFGWYTLPKQVEVYDYSKGLDTTNAEAFRKEIYPIFKEEGFVSTLINMMSLREDTFNEGNAQLFKGLFQLFPVTNEDGGFLDLCKKPIQETLISKVGCGRQEEIQFMALLAEIISGLIRGMKHWSFEIQDKLFKEYIFPEIFDKVLDKCSMSCISEFCEAFEFAVCDKDIRRAKWIVNYLIEKVKIVLEKRENDVMDNNIQIRYLKYLYGVVGEISWRDPSALEYLLNEVFAKCLTHHSEQIREYIALFISLIYKTMWKPTRSQETNLPSFKFKQLDNNNNPNSGSSNSNINIDELQYGSLRKFINDMYNNIKEREENIQRLRNQLDNNNNATTTELGNGREDKMTDDTTTIQLEREYLDFKNLCKTCLCWIGSLFNSHAPHCASGEVMNFIRLISKVYEHSTSQDEDLQTACHNDIIVLSGYPYPNYLASMILDFLHETLVVKEGSTFVNWSIRSSLLEFLQIFGYRQQFVLSDKMNKLFEVITTVLKDNQVEVRQMAAITLSGFLKISDSDYSKSLMNDFYKRAGEKRRQQQVKPQNGQKIQITKEVVERHSGVLGLSSIALAFPYSVPDFIPELLVKLATYANDGVQTIRETVRKSFQEFIKCHSDMWQIHKTKFSEDQLSTLHDLFTTSSPSYYA
ncbi:hypothetical protein ABK040_012994 [Willaertia magna]